MKSFRIFKNIHSMKSFHWNHIISLKCIWKNLIEDDKLIFRYVAHVEIDCPSTGIAWRFPVGKWFATTEEDELIERDIFPDHEDTKLYVAKVPYEFTIVTSDSREVF